MPRPTSATTLAQPRLASLAWEHMASADEFVGTQVLPIFGVPEKTAQYPVIPTEALLEAPETRRAPRGGYNRGDFEFEAGTYTCVEYGWEEVVDDVESNLYQSYFDVQAVAAKRAGMILLRNQEIRIATLLFNASTFSGKTAGVTTEWDTIATCTPAKDVKTAKDAIYNATGVIANTLVISKKVYDLLSLCTTIVDRIKYTNPGVDRAELPSALIAQSLGVDQILVGRGKKNTAKQGQAAVTADIWDDEYALVCRVESGADMTTPSLGRTFLWTGDSPSNITAESYYEDQTRGEIIRVRQHTDEKVLNVATGYLLSNIHT